jgi:hypothetical protein
MTAAPTNFHDNPLAYIHTSRHRERWESCIRSPEVPNLLLFAPAFNIKRINVVTLSHDNNNNTGHGYGRKSCISSPNVLHLSPIQPSTFNATTSLYAATTTAGMGTEGKAASALLTYYISRQPSNVDRSKGKAVPALLSHRPPSTLRHTIQSKEIA